MATGRYYYLGKDRKEYFTQEDAVKYGGGAIKRRWHSPVKEYEDIYDEFDGAEQTSEPVEDSEPETDMLNVSEVVNEWDQFEDKQLKDILRKKGIPTPGNPSRTTLLAKLKSLG